MIEAITTPRRGDVWAIESPVPRTALVVSGNVYNEASEYPYAVVVFLTDDVARPPILVPAGTKTAVVDSIRRVRKVDLQTRLGALSQPEFDAVHTALLRILTTN